MCTVGSLANKDAVFDAHNNRQILVKSRLRDVKILSNNGAMLYALSYMESQSSAKTFRGAGLFRQRREASEAGLPTSPEAVS
jgi:hypothetical protein